jgi:tetratricopeptide (TPR) repeat protein
MLQKMNIFLQFSLLVILLLKMNSTLNAQTPTEEELKALERQIEQQEAEQAQSKQRAAEEAKHKAEQQEAMRKAAEEQIRAEEKARQQAEQEARAAAEAEALRKEEENRLHLEQQREQFARYMQNGDSAMSKKEYPEALQAYTQALEIFPDDPAALSGSSQAREYQGVCAAFVGEWDWFFGTSVIVNADGKLQAIALIPNQGTWECTDPSQRTFTSRWVVGGWVETVTLSTDGNTVDVVNNIGIRFQGWRKGTREEQATPKNPLYGN